MVPLEQMPEWSLDIWHLFKVAAKICETFESSIIPFATLIKKRIIKIFSEILWFCENSIYVRFCLISQFQARHLNGSLLLNEASFSTVCDKYLVQLIKMIKILKSILTDLVLFFFQSLQYLRFYNLFIRSNTQSWIYEFWILKLLFVVISSKCNFVWESEYSFLLSKKTICNC